MRWRGGIMSGQTKIIHKQRQTVDPLQAHI